MQNLPVLSNALCGLLLLLLSAACTTDPILIDGGGGGVIEPPPIEVIPCEGDIVSFEYQVLPIMIASCSYSGCHSRETAEDDVVLVDYASVRREVSPGDANDSDLYESLNDNNDIMPPPPAASLTSAQQTIIRNWINQGANNTDCGAPCNSGAFAFAQDIRPILQDYCVGCHDTNREDGGVNLSSHEDILQYVQDGSLMGSIEHVLSFFPMPPLGNKMEPCKIDQIKNWIADGAPNN